MRNLHLLYNEGGDPGAASTGTTTPVISLADEPTPTPAPATGGDPAPAPTPTDVPEWLKGVDAELVRDKSLSVITNMNDLVKSYINAQKAIGKDKITVPDEFATPEDWRKAMHKLGLPAKEDEYKVEFAETEYFDDEFKNSFKKVAFEHGIMPKQAKEMFNFFQSQTDNAIKTQQTLTTKAMEEQVTKLKDDWGAGFPKELKAAQIALKQFADEGLINELKASGLDSNPTLIRLMNKVAKGLNEDTFSRQTVAHLGTTKDEAQQEHGRIMGDMAHPYWNSDHPNHKSAVDRMLKLQEILISGSPQA